MSEQISEQQPLNGFINVLKPPGMSSAAVVGRVKRLLNVEKIGHAGTLDPEAAGVLPLMVGKATRLFDYLQDKQKGYIAEVAFGCATDTQDAQGKATAHGETYPDEAAIRGALAAFTGELLQTPPMFSALKRDGRPLYDLARLGREVELMPRPVTVHTLQLLGITPRHGALVSVSCSKGFYVRTLCHDLGRALGCPSHMRFLLRTQSGAFTLQTAHTLESITLAAQQGIAETLLTPMDAPVAHLPRADVPNALRKALENGVPMPMDAFLAQGVAASSAPVRLYRDGLFVAMGECQGSIMKVRTWLGG